MFTRWSILFMLMLICSGLFAQTRALKGKILDSRSLELLPLANVYVNFTTIGANADENGEFILKNIPDGEVEIIFSYVGHQDYKLKLTQDSKLPEFIQIKLVPIELPEVVVTEKRDAKWDRQLEKFEQLFLGSDRTRDCEIENPWVLEFKEAFSGIFTATASAPIEIKNSFLGYYVVYKLSEFTFSQTAYIIQGDVWFRELEATDPKLATRWAKNRGKVYRGSPLHLFKSIVEGKERAEGFRVYNDLTSPEQITRDALFRNNLHEKLEEIDCKNFTRQTADGNYLMTLPARTEVHYTKGNSKEIVYRDISHPVSIIEIPAGGLKVSATGIVLNPSNMILQGHMSRARVGELLPKDFQPEKE